MGLLSAVAGAGWFLLGTSAAHADIVPAPGLLTNVAAVAQSAGSSVGSVVTHVITLPPSPAGPVQSAPVVARPAPAASAPATPSRPAVSVPAKATSAAPAPRVPLATASAAALSAAAKSTSTAHGISSSPASHLVGRPRTVASVTTAMANVTTSVITASATTTGAVTDLVKAPATIATGIVTAVGQTVGQVVSQTAGAAGSAPVLTRVVDPAGSIMNGVIGGLSSVVNGTVTSATTAHVGVDLRLSGLPTLPGLPVAPGRPGPLTPSLLARVRPVRQTMSIASGGPIPAAVRAGSALARNGATGLTRTSDGMTTYRPQLGARDARTAASVSIFTSPSTATQVRPLGAPLAPAPLVPGSGVPAATSGVSRLLTGGAGSGRALLAIVSLSWLLAAGVAGALSPGCWALPGLVALRPSVSPA